MQSLPHTYCAFAVGHSIGLIPVCTTNVPVLNTAPPAEFGGPGDQWSPEGLLCAAVADCFVLTFRALSRTSKLDWQSLECRVEGKLERTDGGLRFTQFVTHATLKVAANADVERATRLLEKAEAECLIANSLTGTRSLQTQILTQ